MRSLIKFLSLHHTFTVAFFFCILCTGVLSSCSKKEEQWENIEFGEIDENKEYLTSEKQPQESIVERKQEFDIDDYYGKIPISMSEKETGHLPDITGNEYDIQRFQLNGVSFDINSIAISAGYTDFVDDRGIYHLDLPNGDVSIMVAQIAQGDTATLKADENTYLSYCLIVDSYNEKHDEDPNSMRSDFGGVFTFSQMIDFIENHPELRKDYRIYGTEQRFNLLKETFGLDEGILLEDVFYNNDAENTDYSNWYESIDSFGIIGNEYEIKIVVKRTEDGVFAFLTKWKADSNIHPDTGEYMYSPNLLINFSRNEHWQTEESRNEFIARTGEVL